MTISSSLAAGVAGLNANATRLASISDNIANSATFGYKRTETDFHSMVLEGSAAGGYTAGGVRTTTQRLIDEKGQLEGSGNATDIAIAGRGFLPVTELTAIDQGGNYPLGLKTTGSFRPNADGILVNSMGQVLLGWPANPNGEIPNFPRDSSDGLQPINVYHNQYTANPTTEVEVGVNLPSSETTEGAPGSVYDLTLEYFGNLGQTESLAMEFTPVAPAAPGDPPTNQWTMTISDSATPGAPIGQYTLTFNSGSTDGGTLQSVVEFGGSPPYDPTTGTIPLTVAGGAIAMDVGMLDMPDGMTQLDSSFAPSAIAKNGSAVGNFVGVEVGANGVMRAVYDSGFTRNIYQVPVVDVRNPNGLESLDNQTYQVSRRSGELFMWDAGDGPVGETVGYAREASTTDVANELTQLIQTQRAYSSNAKVIQTVDEMLQETTNLKR